MGVAGMAVGGKRTLIIHPSLAYGAAGAPRNARVGFVQGYPLRSASVPLLLIPGTIIREGLQVIARDPQLNPSAVLEITSVRGRLAVARIVRGQPQPKDEVVLPDPELAEQARSLAP